VVPIAISRCKCTQHLVAGAEMLQRFQDRYVCLGEARGPHLFAVEIPSEQLQIVRLPLEVHLF
jgi:hypothetical protein